MRTRQLFVSGFALFAMFFGAGNLIFPPYLGKEGGQDWVLGFLCFFLVEGYRYTHSRKKYALRLLIFALISQVPYGPCSLAC